MNGNLRVGHGIDVHRFANSYKEGKPLKLGGIIISEKYSLEAHSDGDVVLHGICDAILGACAAGDIGDHFPDTDEAYANIDSAQLLEQVFYIINIDVTIIAQVPKLSPYKQNMVANLCGLLNLDLDRVNVKATTTESLGSIGREEGIACHAIVLMDSKA